MKIAFFLENSADPDEIPPHVAFHLGLHTEASHKRLNPIKPYGISQYYQLGQSIFILALLSGYFHLNSNFY